MQQPSSLCVPTSIAPRLVAVRKLIQPALFAPIVDALSLHTGMAAVADPVVSWMKGMYACKRLQYVFDPSLCNGRRDADLWRSPEATLAAGGGDCEDLAILVVSALMAFGVGGAWLVLGTVGAKGHAWVEGSDTVSGFFVDATAAVLLRDARPNGFAPTDRYHPDGGAQVFVMGGWQPVAT